VVLASRTRKREASIGVSVSATSTETAIASSPYGEIRGTAADDAAHQQQRDEHATSDTLIDTTVKPISRAPSSAACIGRAPSSMWR